MRSPARRLAPPLGRRHLEPVAKGGVEPAQAAEPARIGDQGDRVARLDEKTGGHAEPVSEREAKWRIAERSRDGAPQMTVADVHLLREILHRTRVQFARGNPRDYFGGMPGHGVHRRQTWRQLRTASL